MRAAVIVCEQDCVKGQLDYAFREDYESISGGPSLNPAWGEGTFDTALGPYRYFMFVLWFCSSKSADSVVAYLVRWDMFLGNYRFGPG